MPYSLKVTIYTLIAIVAFVLMFAGAFVFDTEIFVSRVGKEMWNLIHYFFFLILWLIVFTRHRRFLSGPPPAMIAKLTLITLLVGMPVEFIQELIGRTASLNDIGLSLAGTYTAVTLIIASRGNILAALIPLSLAVVLLWPTTRIFIDEVHRNKQFPVLSDFSKPFEISRWSAGNATIDIVSLGSTRVLKATFLPGERYSKVVYRPSPQSWQGYRSLHIDFINPGASTVTATLRIHDTEHNSLMQDRYNRRLILPAGRKTVSIPLDDIANAPRTRQMRLDRIESLEVFLTDIRKKRTLFVARLALSN